MIGSARSSEKHVPGYAALTEVEYRRLCEFLYRRTGMIFTESKRYYVERRVIERMLATESKSFEDYFARLRTNLAGEIEQFVNAFTVNETYFYREEHQLSCLTSDLLPARLKMSARGEQIRIWSVPCSTGEEPYSIDQWKADAESGRLTEAFACGTAAVVTPIGRVKGIDREFTIGGQSVGPLTLRLRSALVDIQRGVAPDPYGWTERVV